MKFEEVQTIIEKIKYQDYYIRAFFPPAFDGIEIRVASKNPSYYVQQIITYEYSDQLNIRDIIDIVKNLVNKVQIQMVNETFLFNGIPIFKHDIEKIQVDNVLYKHKMNELL